MPLFDSSGQVLSMVRERRRAYQLTFSSVPGQLVLADLALFCRANETCFDTDARLHAVAEGRRETWLRINTHIHLPLQDLYAILGGRTLPPTAFELDGDE